MSGNDQPQFPPPGQNDGTNPQNNSNLAPIDPTLIDPALLDPTLMDVNLNFGMNPLQPSSQPPHVPSQIPAPIPIPTPTLVPAPTSAPASRSLYPAAGLLPGSYNPATSLYPNFGFLTSDASTSSSPAFTPSTTATPTDTGSANTGSTRGTKRGRASSTDGSAPPKRPRRNPPRSSGAGGADDDYDDDDDDDNDDDDPGAAAKPATRSKRAAARRIQVRRHRPRRVGEADEVDESLLRIKPKKPKKMPKAAQDADAEAEAEAEEDEDDNASLVYGRGNAEIVIGGTICDFCANHPVGKQMYATNPVCDWKQIPSTGTDVYNLECGNCADFRSRNRQPNEIATKDDHICRVPGPVTALVDFQQKRYGDADPKTYTTRSCKVCNFKKFYDTCDVDTTLGYSCTRCRRDQNCTIAKVRQPVKRPTKLLRRPWYRHACDRCLMRHKRFEAMAQDDCCSWLTDRSQWEQGAACSRCLLDGAPCMDNEAMISEPTYQPVPSTWRIRPRFEVEEAEKKKDRKPKWHEYVEVTTQTKWRRKCQCCQSAGRTIPCVILWTQPYHACERCTQFGIECAVLDNNTNTFIRYPIYDLSRVGFGHHTPYVVCDACAENGRNCDRQRPCDSCTRYRRDKCDSMHKDITHGCVARNKSAANDKPTQPQNPGPLYYLALGYGPDGVDSIKDGRNPAHWIGPVAPVYGIVEQKDSKQHYRAINDLHREHRPPQGVMPPNGTLLGALANKIPREFTVGQLGDMITQLWDNPKVPVSDLAAYRKIWDQLRDAQTNKMKEAGVDTLPVIDPGPRTFQGNPVLIDLECLHLGLSAGAPDVIHRPQDAGLQPPGQQLDVFGLQPFGQQPNINYQSQYPPIGEIEGEDLYSAYDLIAGMPGGQFSNNAPQQQGNDLMGAADFIQAGQQAAPAPDVDITQLGQDEVRALFGLDEVSRERHLATQKQRWPLPTASGISKPDREGTAFWNRVPVDPNAKKAFNPFLGFALDQNHKPRFKTNTKSSRWKIFNPLEDLNMDEWRRSTDKSAPDRSQPHLFSVINGQANQSVPWRDVLGDVPYKQRGERTEHCCAEPGEGGIGYCGSWNINEQDQATCQSLTHRNTVPGYFPVCNDCTQGNVRDLFRHEYNPITESELLSMRAYLCNDCAGHMSNSAQNAAQYRVIGARRIYGVVADAERAQTTYKPENDPSSVVEFQNDTEAFTGCSCGNRMLGTSLCRFHRLHYAEEALKNSAMIQEWRLSHFKKAVCPSCLAQRPLEQVNLSADFGGFVSGAPTAWACVNCSDWVANEKNGEGNQPGVIDKALWNLNIGRELLGPRQGMVPGRIHATEDVEMMDG
ncbi:hypothetical protein ACHAPA_010049 [Fusarium lateritium]